MFFQSEGCDDTNYYEKFKDRQYVHLARPQYTHIGLENKSYLE